MQVKNFLYPLLAICFVAACDKSEQWTGAQQTQSVEVSISASHSAMSRTALGDVPSDVTSGSEQPIEWSVGDKISVWAKADGDENYTLDGVTFTLSTYNSTFDDADFMATIDPMLEGTYAYHAVYPEPTAKSGTKVSYTLPSNQSGAYDPALDVMAAQATGNALVGRVDDEPTNLTWQEPQLEFNHLFHMIRIRIPEGKNLLGQPIKRLDIVFPRDVVGTAEFDVTNPSNITWSNMSNKITVEIPDESNYLDENSNYVWLYIKAGELSGDLKFRAYSLDGIPSQEITSSINKDFKAERVTPINLTIPESDETAYKEITFSCPDNETYPNFLGENATTMYVREWPATLKPIKSQSATISSSGNGVFKVKFYYLNNEDYQFNTTSNSATMTVAFDSANASMSNNKYSLKLPNFGDSSETYYALPYLFYEDFVNMKPECVTGDDNDTNIAGVLLDSQYFTTIRDGKYGWTGSNVIGEIGSISIKAKADRYIGSTAYYRGRLDSSQIPLSGSVNVAVSFDYKCSAGTVFTPNMTYGQTTEAKPIQAHTYRIVAIKYNYGNKVSGTEKVLSSGQTGTQIYQISNCTGSHRLSWDVFGSGGSGNTTEYQTLSLDNIKVSIGGSVKHAGLEYRKFFPNHTN